MPFGKSTPKFVENTSAFEELFFLLVMDKQKQFIFFTQLSLGKRSNKLHRLHWSAKLYSEFCAKLNLADCAANAFGKWKNNLQF